MNLSVVIATWNRPGRLRRLLSQLCRQTLPAEEFEVVVVDDGSETPAAEALAGLEPAFALRIVRQRNAGAAAARHAGAVAAAGEILVLIDDDMQVAPDFLEQHLAVHRLAGRVVVLGRIGADAGLRELPLFERWHAHLLDRKADRIRSGELQARGNLLFTGNVSLRREDYLAAGGFDVTLGQSEDIELGMRLQKLGVAFQFSEAATSLHGSDHDSLARWRRRARRYGACDLRVGRKHPDLRDASPWRLLFDLHPLTRAFIRAALRAPAIGRMLAAMALALALLLDQLGLEQAAFAGMSVAYSLEYFRGVREEAGPRAFAELAEFADRFETRPGAAFGT